MRLQRAHIPGAQFIVLPEAAHSINREAAPGLQLQRPKVHPRALANSGARIGPIVELRVVNRPCQVFIA